MKEDAIAPVIAVMLLLAIGVTFFSIYTTTYLPGLKEQAEVEHAHEVETGVLKFSSDIDNAIYKRNEGILTEQIPLGGGDIIVNSLKSSGYVRIQDEPSYIIIRNCTGCEISDKDYKMYMVNFSYTPIGNFWVDQGYTWRYGYVNITKGKRSTPLQYYTMDETENQTKIFGQALITIPPGNGKPNITVNMISFVKSERNFSSGNGIAQISLNATNSEPKYYSNTTGFSFLINHTSPLNATLCKYLSFEMNKIGMDVSINLLGSDMEISVTPRPPTETVNITINELRIKLETQ